MAVRVGEQLWVAPEDAPEGSRHPLSVDGVREGLVFLTGDTSVLRGRDKATVLVPGPGKVVTYRAQVVSASDNRASVRIGDPLAAMQRRSWFRVPAEVPLKATVAGLGSSDVRWRVLDGTSIDLSAGGMRFVSRGPVPEARPMALDLTLDDEVVHATAAPVFISTRPADGNAETAVRFITISPADRQRLVSAVLERQRDLVTTVD